MDDSVLRVGILIDSYSQPRWIYHVLSEIDRSPFAKVVLVILNGSSTGRVSIFRSVWRQRQHLLYRTYNRIDRALFTPHPDAFEICDLRPILSESQAVSVVPIRKKYSDYFSNSDVNRIRQHQPDVLLRFGFRILRGDILDVPRYGVWSYHHGDNLVYRGGPPGFWEVMDRTPVTGSILQVLNENLDAGKVLYRSYSHTDLTSVVRNKNRYYWKSASFVIRQLKELYENRNQFKQNKLDNNSLLPYGKRLYKKPTNLEFLPLLSKFVGRSVVDRTRDLVSRNQWLIAYSLKKGRMQPEENAVDFESLIPPSDRSWADPFPVKLKDKYFIFLEEFLYRKGRGHISMMEMDESGHHTSPSPVLVADTHLSYPFVFEWNNNHYMIPETAQKREVQLYRCVSFPDQWTMETVLIENKKAVDATLIHVDDLWWMFVNIAELGASTFDELHLYYASSPVGPWKPHRKNPVKSDCRSARPAGNLFWRDTQLYRPAQDCSIRYGYAISVNRVQRLDRDTFAEVEVHKILPHWKKGLLATHMINTCDNLTVLDGMHRTSRIPLGKRTPIQARSVNNTKSGPGRNVVWNR